MAVGVCLIFEEGINGGGYWYENLKGAWRQAKWRASARRRGEISSMERSNVISVSKAEIGTWRRAGGRRKARIARIASRLNAPRQQRRA
jgi:hypothetical protein